MFPLLDTTTAQAAGLVDRLNADGEGSFRAYLGMKHSTPFIPEGVAAMRADGIDHAVGIVMAPHWSGMSIETYVERTLQAIDQQGGGIEMSFVRSFHDHPAFVAYLADRVAETMATLADDERRERDRAVHRPLAPGAGGRRRHAALHRLRLRRRRAGTKPACGGRATSSPSASGRRTTASPGSRWGGRPTRGGAPRSTT